MTNSNGCTVREFGNYTDVPPERLESSCSGQAQDPDFEFTPEQLDRFFRGPDEAEKPADDSLFAAFTKRGRDPESERLVADAKRLCGKARDRLAAIRIDASAECGESLQSIMDKCELLARRLEGCEDPESLGEEIGELCSETAQSLRMRQAVLNDSFMKAGRLLKMISDKCELII